MPSSASNDSVKSRPHLRPVLSTASTASSATMTIFESATSSRSMRGDKNPASTTLHTTSALVELTMLDTAQAASLRTSHSLPERVCAMILASRPGKSATALICACVPAVMLESAQHVSLRMAFLRWLMRFDSTWSSLLSIACCVHLSLPETTLPTVRSAGVMMVAFCVEPMRLINKGTAPESTTPSMRASSPSDTYDSAQQASVTTSSSAMVSRWRSAGKAGEIALSAGLGLPRHRLDKLQVTLRRSDGLAGVLMLSSTLCSMCVCVSSASRYLALSPAMLPRHHAACSRTSAAGARRRLTKCGQAPASTTTCVCSVDAMLVRAQAASNIVSVRDKNFTSDGTMPWSSTSCTGGSCSLDSSLRTMRTA
mmetsp:Transcript_156338/g.379658  ORF Transcript_156338/g.379658 Transcript_156338/m.379658 type:complete len:368 (-) Transcript_156338:52-1155(-)